MAALADALTVHLIVRWVHLIAAIIWVGGMTFATFALMPGLRSTVDPWLGSTIMGQVVRRFRLMVSTGIILMVLTGLYNMHTRLSSFSLLFHTTWGIILFVKLFLVAGMVSIFLGAPRLTAYSEYYCCDPGQRHRVAPIAGGSGADEGADTHQAPARQNLSVILHVVAISLGVIVILLAKILTVLPVAAGF